MTAQETNLLNAFETTLNATAGASDLTFTVNTVTDAASNTLTAPCYLVINPDSATNREVILVTSINAGTKTLTCDNINKRFLTGSAATSGLSHSSGATVRVSPVQQHIEDLNDRVDTIINEAGTAVNTSLFLDEDDMSSNSATKGVTQQSVKAYVDSQVTAQDLDFGGDSGTGAVDLDSQTFTIAGTANEIETSATGQTLTIGLPTTITTTLSGTSVLSDGVTATTQSASDNSTKVATTAYVDAQITAEDLDVTADSGGPISIDLDSETLDIAGGTGITTTASGNEISIAIDSTVVTESSTDTLTNKTIDADGTGNSITNIEDANIKSAAAIDASKIADGSVSNAEFQRLDGVTSDIQTQLDGKQASGSYITASSTDTLTNKTIDADGTGNSITNIEDANIKASAAIDASKIADGSVSNAEFQRLDGVTSDIQTQLDAKGVGDITAVNTAANSGLAGGAASGDASLTVDPSNLTDGTGIIVDTANDFLIMEDVTDGTVYKVNPDQIASGSANQLAAGDSDFTLTDTGTATGIHYELDNVDTADWNQGGIALTAAGGMFRHNQTQSSTFTIAATEGTVMAGPITITGTVTNAGTMVIL